MVYNRVHAIIQELSEVRIVSVRDYLAPAEIFIFPAPGLGFDVGHLSDVLCLPSILHIDDPLQVFSFESELPDFLVLLFGPYLTLFIQPSQFDQVAIHTDHNVDVLASLPFESGFKFVGQFWRSFVRRRLSSVNWVMICARESQLL